MVEQEKLIVIDQINTKFDEIVSHYKRTYPKLDLLKARDFAIKGLSFDLRYSEANMAYKYLKLGWFSCHRDCKITPLVWNYRRYLWHVIQKRKSLKALKKLRAKIKSIENNNIRYDDYINKFKNE